MKKQLLLTQNKEIKEQIKHFERRVKWQESRGRYSGTYDHQRLEELQKLLKESKQMEVIDYGKQDLERCNDQPG